MCVIGQVFWGFFTIILLVVVKWFFGTILFLLVNKLVKVLAVWYVYVWFKNFVSVLIGLQLLFSFYFLIYFLLYCSFFRVSAAIFPFTIMLLLYLGFQFMLLLQFCMGNI